jgi:UPF0755 protein
MGWLLRTAAAGIAGAALAAAVLLWGALRMTAPGPATAPVTVVVPSGSGIEAVAFALDDGGVIDQPLVFVAAAILTGRIGSLKAGEYAFPVGVSMDAAMRQMAQGRTVVHRLTVPEGLTSAQVMALLEAESALSGSVSGTPENGTLLPDTYHFSLGDSRQSLIDRMTAGMSQAVADAWKDKGAEVRLASPRDLVTLASIVEKETAVAAERPRIAGVFLNRLVHGMRLQSDPTVIFALTNGAGELGRALTRADWKFDSPYNTYVAAGLPPGPIANPGRAALKAVAHPERHEYIYFVADGTGGHAFAATLAEHNRNVARWRAIGQSSSDGGPVTSAEQ